MSAEQAKNMRLKVQTFQNKLSCAAKQTLDRKFGALYDKIYRKDVLWMAWKQVRSNKGAPGIDKESIDYIEEEIGVEKFLMKIQEELRRQTYRPKAVLRCWIDKPGKTEKRPLGIPVIRDRVAQTATRLVIEPIFETNFVENSYGFRPGRSCHQVSDAIRHAVNYGKQYQVIDADIKGFFDNIRKPILVRLLQKRISDPRILKLIKGWLDAGVMNEGKYESATELGTPQGSTISPLLSNIYLHAFDKMWEASNLPGTLIRYADDFVILHKGNGRMLLEQVRQMLSRLGLELHEDKTRLAHLRDGFDFVGFHFRTQAVRKKDSYRKWTCWRWPSKKAIQGVKQKVRLRIGKQYGLSLEEMIKEVNPTIRGWFNFHRHATRRDCFRKLNRFIRERFRIFLKRKHSDDTRGCRRLHENLLVRLGLFQLR